MKKKTDSKTELTIHDDSLVNVRTVCMLRKYIMNQATVLLRKWYNTNCSYRLFGGATSKHFHHHIRPTSNDTDMRFYIWGLMTS